MIAAGSATEPVPVPGGEHVHAVGDLEAAHRLRLAFAALPAGTEVAVVGGGFTGLETVAELAESRPDVRVRLVTAGEVGGWFTPRAAEHVRRTLARLGIETVGGRRVRAVEPDRLLLDDGAEVPSALDRLVRGFAAPPLARTAGIAVDDRGAVLTDAALRSLSHPAVLAVGDAGHTPGPARTGSACPASSRSRRRRTRRTCCVPRRSGRAARARSTSRSPPARSASGATTPCCSRPPVTTSRPDGRGPAGRPCSPSGSRCAGSSARSAPSGGCPG
ncbi:hypothetical protein BJF78_21275 [Pseudonocardia sp. CNS-139]|nr:hypothetical protein BJF78_21275 [Pseudonocardia sp. CNS-139]